MNTLVINLLNQQATCSNFMLRTVKWAPHNVPQKWMRPRGLWPWGIQIGAFGVHETYFSNMNFHFFNRPHAAFPFSCTQWKGSPQLTSKVNETKGCMTMGHSNWTICSPWTQFLQYEFHFINRPHAAFPFSCIQWNGHHSDHTMYPKVNDTKGYMTLGHSNWTICNQWN